MIWKSLNSGKVKMTVEQQIWDVRGALFCLGESGVNEALLDDFCRRHECSNLQAAISVTAEFLDTLNQRASNIPPLFRLGYVRKAAFEAGEEAMRVYRTRNDGK